MLDLRAPEDRLLSNNSVNAVRRSSTASDRIATYHSADQDDDQRRVGALMGVIEAHRADMAASGVPVFAHAPLPDDFAAELTQGQSALALADVLVKLEPSVRRLVAQQLEQGPAGGGRYALLGGDDEDGSQGSRSSPPQRSRGQAPGAPPIPREKPPLPSPMQPRPHPDSEQREAEWRAQCKKDWDDLGAINEAIRFYYQKLKEAEAELARLESAPLDQRRRERVILIEKLNKARSRSTEPGIPPFPPCPTRRPAHARDIACEIVREGLIDRWNKEERARLQKKKEADIAELQRQLAELDALIEDAPNKIAAKKAQIADIRQRLGHLAIGEKRVRDQFNARGCGQGAPY
jgi:hypothetical protein